jgi:polysaccharide chain length determinant protein (PEP-CTERM system associated)
MEATQMTPKEYVEILKRRKGSLILPALIIFLIGVSVAFALPSIYKSTSTILIEEQDIPSDFVMTTVTSYAEQRLQTINQRIMSFSRLLEIIQRFNLYPEYVNKWTPEDIVEKMREDTTLEPISAEVIDRRTGRPTSATIAFTLSYEGKNPNTVQQIANVLTSFFLSENLQVRKKQAEDTTAFLETELEKIKAELADLEARISLFKKEHINELPEMLVVHIRSLSDLEINMARIGEQLQGLKERKQYLQIQLASIEPHIDKEEDRANQRRLDELKVELVHLTKRFSDEYPDVKKTRAEIADLEKQLADANLKRKSTKARPDNPAYINLSAQLAGTRTEIDSTLRQIEKLNLSAEEMRRKIAATPKVEESYNSLIGERLNTQQQYNELMQKYMEARVAQGLEKEQKGERFTLIDPARLPAKPHKPNRIAIMLIGIVLGIGAGLCFAALREFSDDAVRKVDQLERVTNFPVLAGIPLIITKKDIRLKRMKRFAWATGSLGVIVGAVLVFHFFVMDLNVFWAKLMRRLVI